jgi:hypothetical protein
MTTTEHPERSVPKVQFTDAEAGAKEFPDSSASARHYNYFKAAPAVGEPSVKYQPEITLVLTGP